MGLEKLQHDTEIIEQANIAANKLTQVMKVCLLYNQGADAEACMQRIKNILTGGPND